MEYRTACLNPLARVKLCSSKSDNTVIEDQWSKLHTWAQLMGLRRPRRKMRTADNDSFLRSKYTSPSISKDGSSSEDGLARCRTLWGLQLEIA